MVLARGLRVAMVAYGDITYDSRVQREATSLASAGHAVTVFCLAGSREVMGSLGPRVRVCPRAARWSRVVPGTASPFRQQDRGGPVRTAVRQAVWLWLYWWNLRRWGDAVTRAGGARAFDVWHVHDFAGLVAVAGARPGPGRGLVYDVHDLFVETGTAARLPLAARLALRRYECHLVRRVDATIAVNDGVAAVLRRRYRPRSIAVIHNCPAAWSIPSPRPDLIRRAAGIPHTAPVILYHGQLGSNRGLERLCEAMLEPDLIGAHLVLMGNGELRGTLLARADAARFEGRIHVLDAVPPGQLLTWVASADVGVMALPRTTLNLYISTPNKLFECLAAGTPVVVSDFPAVRSIVLDGPWGPLGATCDPCDPSAIARAVAGVIGCDSGTRDQLRARCSTAALTRWNWESQAAPLLRIYEDIARAIPHASSRD